MKYQTIINLLDNTSNQPSKFIIPIVTLDLKLQC